MKCRELESELQTQAQAVAEVAVIGVWLELLPCG